MQRECLCMATLLFSILDKVLRYKLVYNLILSRRIWFKTRGWIQQNNDGIFSCIATKLLNCTRKPTPLSISIAVRREDLLAMRNKLFQNSILNDGVQRSQLPQATASAATFCDSKGFCRHWFISTPAKPSAELLAIDFDP